MDSPRPLRSVVLPQTLRLQEVALEAAPIRCQCPVDSSNSFDTATAMRSQYPPLIA
jgi:hypothetical protein